MSVVVEVVSSSGSCYNNTSCCELIKQQEIKLISKFLVFILTNVLTVVVDKGRVVIECVVGGVVVVVVVDDNAEFQISNRQNVTSIELNNLILSSIKNEQLCTCNCCTFGSTECNSTCCSTAE